MAGFNIADFFALVSFKTDEGSQARAVNSYAKFEKAVKDSEARIEKAKAEGAKASVRYALEIEAAQHREVLEAAKTAAKVAEAEALKVRAHQQSSRQQAEAIGFSVTKYMALLDVVTRVATAVSSSIGGMVGGFDRLHYVSGRTGASVESLKNLEHAFTQVGGKAGEAVSAVESFQQKLRNNEGLRGFVKGLGVDMTKDGAQQMLDTVAALNAQNGREVGALQAGMLGISEEQYDLMVRQSEGVKRYYAERAKAVKAFNLDEKAAGDASAKLMQSLGTLSVTAEVGFSKLLTAVVPRLTAWIERITEWFKSNQEQIGQFITWIGDKIELVGNKADEFFRGLAGTLEDKEKQKAFDAWKDGLTGIGDAIQRITRFSQDLVNSPLWRLLKLLTIDNPLATWPSTLLGKVIGGAEASGYNSRTDAGPAGTVPPDDRTLWQRMAPKALGGKDAPAAGSGSRSFRNNNPGNIKAGAFADSMGATGKDDAGFATFPDYATGRKAQESLLFNSKGYKDLTIAQAIARWAPGSDGNDPVGYAAQMAKAAGVDVNTKLADLTPDQRSRFLDAQQRKEGWIPAAAPGTVSGTGRQVAGDVAPVNGVGGVLQRQASAKYRRQNIADTLRDQIRAASIAAGVNAEIYSGGQDESGPGHTGSHRHDHGGSADLKLYVLDENGKPRFLSMNNDADRSKMEAFIRESVKAGANGVGSGPGYMGESGIHVGGGSPAAWGAGGSSANAPDWVRSCLLYTSPSPRDS